jgi:hypothetical protein
MWHGWTATRQSGGAALSRPKLRGTAMLGVQARFKGYPHGTSAESGGAIGPVFRGAQEVFGVF